MMKPISHSLRDVLVRQGIANAKPVGAGKVRGMKGPGAASDGARGGVAADALQGGTEHPPIGRPGGARQPMAISGKGRGPLKPAPVSDSWKKRQHGSDGGTRHAIHATLRLIVNPNMSGMPMRKGAVKTPFLICIEGGRT